MTATEIQQTAGTPAGTWNTLSNAGYSGGSAAASGAAGATLTFTAAGRALWLLTASGEGGGAFTVSIDGVNSCGGSCFGVGAATRYRVLLPLGRALSDGPHTVTISAASAAPVTVDSLIAVSGPPAAPTAGQVAALGDSITAGYGLANQLGSFPARTADLLGRKLGRPFTLANKGLSGDSLFGLDGTKTGGMYRLATDLSALSPEVLTVMFGTNDLMLNATVPGEFAAHLLSTLQLIEDLFAVAQMAVIICVPTYLAPLAMACAPGGNQAGYYAGMTADNHRLALELLKVTASWFPWATIAYTNEVMDEADSLVYPNGGFDSTHPNDAGHSVLAIEVLRAVLERFAKIGRS